MRTTIEVEQELVTRALEETGVRSGTEVIEMALRLLLAREARKRLKALAGTMNLDEVRR